MALFRFTALAFLTAATLLSQSAYAADNIKFIAKDAFKNTSARSIMAAYDFSEIAPTDLNQDGIDEFILKQSTDNKASKFRVIAQNDSGNVDLGVIIEANKLMISYSRFHGIRSILAFNNVHNDFDYDVYQWSAEKLSYVLKDNNDQGGKI